MSYSNEIQEAVSFIRSQTTESNPQVAIILGSGLGGLSNRISGSIRIPFADIPHFARSTATGHRGELVLGCLAGRSVVAMAGRFHRYEGWSRRQVTFPVQVMAALGATTLIVSNAAGGLRSHFSVGDIMVIRDHIDRIPWRTSDQGAADDSASLRVTEPSATTARFPQHDPNAGCPRGHSPYSVKLANAALQAARLGDFSMHQGTYLATLGPTYETRAEYRMMRRLGADCVGMSTVPEVLQAQALGMEILALSMISNVAKPDAAQETTHQEVLDAGRSAEPRMSSVVEFVLGQMSS